MRDEVPEVSVEGLGWARDLSGMHAGVREMVGTGRSRAVA